MSDKNWNELTDSEKTEAFRQWFQKNDFANFDYAAKKAWYEKVENDPELSDRKWSFFPEWKTPSVVLRLVDPILTDGLMSWMYTDVEVGGYKGKLPLFGYAIDEIRFNANADLSGLSSEEVAIIREAANILHRKLNSGQ